jgi:homocysteine S-methyltransferase
MHRAADPIAEGVQNAKTVLAMAREHFSGACIMPPFDHFEIMPEILRESVKP